MEIQETSILRACKSTVFFILEGTVFCNVLVALPGNIDFYAFFPRRNGQILGALLVLKKVGYSMKHTSIFLTRAARTLRFTFGTAIACTPRVIAELTMARSLYAWLWK